MNASHIPPAAAGPSIRYAAGGRAFSRISQFHPELTAFRRDLHANPEIGFEEVYTAARITEALKACGVDEIHDGFGKTGLVATIKGRADTRGAMLGLRADMDALQMVEQGDRPWRSGISGVMHGCGHDGHTAMLIGAARYLAETRRFDGTAVLVFQPGEEGFAGARAMIEDGLFERFPVSAIYAMHNWPGLPPGKIATNPGAIMAAADRITITIEGKGGHGAHAYAAVDPVLVAAHIITAAQGIVSRSVRGLDAAVVSLCAMQAGDLGSMSVIPAEATLVGTVRTFSTEVQSLIERRLDEVCTGVAAAFGATARVRYERIYPATINTPREAMFAADTAAAILGEDHVVRDMDASMGAEDFSFMLRERPGAYLRIGQGADGAASAMLHSARYDFNDDILPLGAALHAGLVERGMPLAEPA